MGKNTICIGRPRAIQLRQVDVVTLLIRGRVQSVLGGVQDCGKPNVSVKPPSLGGRAWWFPYHAKMAAQRRSA